MGSCGVLAGSLVGSLVGSLGSLAGSLAALWERNSFPGYNSFPHLTWPVFPTCLARILSQYIIFPTLAGHRGKAFLSHKDPPRTLQGPHKDPTRTPQGFPQEPRKEPARAHKDPQGPHKDPQGPRKEPEGPTLAPEGAEGGRAGATWANGPEGAHGRILGRHEGVREGARGPRGFKK